MKQRLLAAALAVLICAQPSPVRAEALVLSAEQIELMSRYCTEARGHLERLHYSDALLRVNLGQRYENISKRLMAPMNSRIALAGEDGVAMSETTVDFNEELAEFRSNYQSYDTDVDDVMGINCREQPVQFYQEIQVARQKREQVNNNVQELSKLIKQYRSQFEAFTKQPRNNESSQS